MMGANELGVPKCKPPMPKASRNADLAKPTPRPLLSTNEGLDGACHKAPAVRPTAGASFDVPPANLLRQVNDLIEVKQPAFAKQLGVGRAWGAAISSAPLQRKPSRNRQQKPKRKKSKAAGGSSTAAAQARAAGGGSSKSAVNPPRPIASSSPIRGSSIPLWTEIVERMTKRTQQRQRQAAAVSIPRKAAEPSAAWRKGTLKGSPLARSPKTAAVTYLPKEGTVCWWRSLAREVMPKPPHTGSKNGGGPGGCHE
ncbi:hypothetical protein KM043_013179 [Ampulex compressa]|nr:hypothetical protein KM043_013179 [Ampulex compressa]